MDLLIGTANKGKIIEVTESLSSFPLTIVTPLDLGISDVPDETGSTFAENAEQKARFYFERAGLATLADDSGIMVNALQNELGIHTRRWGAGKEATDEEWISYFLDRMSREEDKTAYFTCVLCFIDSTGKTYFFEGRCDGVITSTLQAAYLSGLPISACFQPNGYSQVYSALPTSQKNDISHRGRALQLFKQFLTSNGTNA